MNRRRAIWVVLLTTALLLPAAPALARNELPDDGVTIWNENFTLPAGDIVEGDLLVFNGSATLEPNSRVEGSVVVWNGDAEIEGTVEQDLVVTSGTIDLGDKAWIQGNIVCSLDCSLDRTPDARVDGTVIEGLAIPGIRLEALESLPLTWPARLATHNAGWAVELVLRAIRGLISILVVSIVAGLVALIWPRSIMRVGQTMLDSPGPSFGIGLLTVVAAGALMIALILTICLPPIVLLALVISGLFGWTSVGMLVGERFLKAVNARQVTPMWSAALGTLFISLVAAGLDLLPCIGVLGWIAACVAGCFGLGAVVLTRFGTRRYVPTPTRTPQPSTQPPELMTYHEPEPEQPMDSGQAGEEKPPDISDQST